MKQSITVFLCTPRCGTQWFFKNLAEYYSDEAVVLHEPIENEYHLKLNLGRYDSPVNPQENPALAGHLDFIDEVTQNKKYIEIGWQSITGVPELYRRFGDRLRLIHLYRNPVYVAASMVTHNWYTGKVKDRFEKSELTPFDQASLLNEYRDRWSDINVFEKSLFYWTEINLHALDLKYRYKNIPFCSFKFENLFEDNSEISRIQLIEALSFMNLDYNCKMLESIEIPQDQYHFTTDFSFDWKDLYNHPPTIALAELFGYNFDDNINLQKYRKQKLKKAKNVFLKITSRIHHIFNLIPTLFHG